MINRIFFIGDKIFSPGDPRPEENIYYTLLADPSVQGSLEQAYRLIGQADHSTLALTLDIREPLNAENIRFITSFLFIPSYLVLENRPVISLRGNSPALLQETAMALSEYFSLQGCRESGIHILIPADTENDRNKVDEEGENPKKSLLFHSEAAFVHYYQQLLQEERNYNRDIFLYAPSGEFASSLLSSLYQEEQYFSKQFPGYYSLIHKYGLLEKELYSLRKYQRATQRELDHQKQYADILRSGNAAKELQDYYTNEYEILPLWYKRLGHVLKVLTGKRTFKSLFRDGVKKYKD